MKLVDIMNMAIEEGILTDPRQREEIERILIERKKDYDDSRDIKKEIYDLHLLESPYTDSRIIWGDPEKEVKEAWIGIDVDTAELLLVDRIGRSDNRDPVVISHHPLGRSRSNFYEVMDMQADILSSMGIASSVADNLTRSRKAEVSRKVSGANHFKTQDAARILNIPVLNIHTPADNHVKKYLDDTIQKEKPYKLKDILDILLDIEEYKISSKRGQVPHLLTGNQDNKCGKIFVDMTGGTEGDPELLKNLVQAGVSTVVGMHYSDKHLDRAKDSNLNIIVAGHISSDNLGMNLLIDKIIDRYGSFDIVEFSGYIRVKRTI